MATVFWDCGVVILFDVMQREMSFNSDAYIKTLKKIRELFQRVRADKNLSEMLLQHDNAKPHTSVKTRDDVTQVDGRCYHIHPTAPT